MDEEGLVLLISEKSTLSIELQVGGKGFVPPIRAPLFFRSYIVNAGFWILASWISISRDRAKCRNAGVEGTILPSTPITWQV